MELRYPLKGLLPWYEKDASPLQCEVANCPNMATHIIKGDRGHRYYLCPIHLAEQQKRTDED